MILTRVSVSRMPPGARLRRQTSTQARQFHEMPGFSIEQGVSSLQETRNPAAALHERGIGGGGDREYHRITQVASK